MDGDLTPSTELTLASIFHRFEERLATLVDERLAAFESDIAGRLIAATRRLDERLEESRRRAEDAITGSAEAVRTLAADVAAQQRQMPELVLAQVGQLPVRELIEEHRRRADGAIRVSAETARELV